MAKQLPPGWTLTKEITGYAYARNGNTHNPTPRVTWHLRDATGRRVDQDSRKRKLVEFHGIEVPAKPKRRLAAEVAAVLDGAPPRLTKAQIRKLQVELNRAVKYEKSDHPNMGHDDYERAAEVAARVAGIRDQVAAQPNDEGVEIWEVIPGIGTVGDQIASFRERP